MSVCPDSFAGPAESFSRGSSWTTPSSATVAVSSTAVGASFAGRTVTETAPVSVSAPSETVYEKVAVPKKPGAGVYRSVPAICVTVPWPAAGCVNAVTVSASPSTSVSFASTAMSTATPSSVVAASSTATGGSLTGVTVKEIVDVAHFGSGAPAVVPLSQTR